MKKLLVILDAGHGGIIDGLYVTAPAKQFKHADGSWAYEGVINREIKNALKVMLKQCNIAYYDITPNEADIPIRTRTESANIVKVKNIQYQCLYLSIHSNGGGGRGFEVFTTPGNTNSDKYATILAEEIKKAFPDLPFRADMADSDLDKEANFYVLVHTTMPSLLAELLFFDNPADWAIIKTPEYKQKMAKVLCSFLVRAQNEIS